MDFNIANSIMLKLERDRYAKDQRHHFKMILRATHAVVSGSINSILSAISVILAQQAEIRSAETMIFRLIQTPTYSMPPSLDFNSVNRASTEPGLLAAISEPI